MATNFNQGLNIKVNLTGADTSKAQLKQLMADLKAIINGTPLKIDVKGMKELKKLLDDLKNMKNINVNVNQRNTNTNSNKNNTNNNGQNVNFVDISQYKEYEALMKRVSAEAKVLEKTTIKTTGDMNELVTATVQYTDKLGKSRTEMLTINKETGDLVKSSNVLVENSKKEADFKAKIKAMGTIDRGIKLKTSSGIDDIRSQITGQYSGAEITNVSGTMEKLGQKIKEVEFKVQDGANSFKTYRATINDTMKSVRVLETGIIDVEKQVEKMGAKSTMKLGITSSLEDIKSEIGGKFNGAEITKVTGITEKFGQKIKEVSFEVNEGAGKFRQFKATINETEGSVRVLSTGLKDVSKQIESMGTIKPIKLTTTSGMSDIKSQIASMYSGAEVGTVTGTMEKFGQTVKEVSFRVKDGSDKFKTYRATINDTEGSVRVLETGFKDVSNRQISLSEAMQIAIKRMAEWAVAGQLLYGSLQQIRDGIQFINDMNKMQTNVKMIAGFNQTQVDEMTKSLASLGKQMGETTTNMMKGAEEYLRAGYKMEQLNSIMKATTMASKISGMDSGAVSEDMLAILNGFSMKAEDSMMVVDSLTTIDNNCATSFGELSEAMKHTSETAQQNGVGFQKLASFIGTVSSVTRRSASTIGEAFKTIFTRMEKLKKGVNDEDNFAIGDVEQVLNKIGIAVRSDATHFRNMQDVLDETAVKWGDLNDIQQVEIATAISGVHQRETFMALMNNYQDSLKLYGDELKSVGSAELRYGEYQKSTEASMNRLKNATEQMWMAFIKSDVIISVVDAMTGLVGILDQLINKSQGCGVALLALSGVLVVLAFNVKRLGLEAVNEAIISLIPNIAKAIVSGQALTAVVGGLTTAVEFLLSPIGLVIAGVGALAFVITTLVEKQRRLSEDVKDTTQSYKLLTQAMKDNNVESIKSESGNLEGKQKNLQDIIQKKTDIQNQINELQRQQDEKNKGLLPWQQTTDSGYLNQLEILKAQLGSLNGDYADLTKVLNDSGVAFDQNTGEIYANTQARLQLENNNIADGIRKEAEAEFKHKQEIISLINEYKALDAVQDKNAIQKQRMSQLSQDLSGKIGNLKIATDEHGNSVITNTDLLGKEINVLTTEGNSVTTLANVKLTSAKAMAQIEVGNTKVTYTEAKARIRIMKEEADAIKAKMTAQLIAGSAEGVYKMVADYNKLASEIGAFQDSVNALDSIYSTSGSAGSPSANIDKYIPPNTNSTEKASTAKTPEQIREENNQKILDLQKSLTDALKKQYEEDSKNKTDELKKQQDAEDEYYNGKNGIITKLQEQLDALKDDRSEVQTNIDQIKADLANWQQDDSVYAQGKVKDLQKKLQDEQKTLAEKNLEKEIKDKQDEAKWKKDDLESRIKDEEEALKNKLADETAILQTANDLMNGKVANAQVTMLNLLKTYASEYAGVGSLLGQSFSDAMNAKLQEGLQAVRANGGSTAGGSGSSTSGSISSGGGGTTSSGGSTWNGTLYKTGSTGEQVKAIQKIVGVSADGIWGNQTNQAVINWQRSHGLTADGVVGSATWNAMFGSSTSTNSITPASTANASLAWDGKLHRYGESGETVKRIQRNLGITADGVWGNQTQSKVLEFQRNNGLTADGVIGQSTWSKLIKFNTGGIPINEGLAYVHGKERILTADQTKSFDKLVNMYLPIFGRISSFGMDTMPKSRINFNAPVVQNEIKITNNTPFDVENNMDNLGKAIKQELKTFGYRANL